MLMRRSYPSVFASIPKLYAWLVSSLISEYRKLQAAILVTLTTWVSQSIKGATPFWSTWYNKDDLHENGVAKKPEDSKDHAAMKLSERVRSNTSFDWGGLVPLLSWISPWIPAVRLNSFLRKDSENFCDRDGEWFHVHAAGHMQIRSQLCHVSASRSFDQSRMRSADTSCLSEMYQLLQTLRRCFLAQSLRMGWLEDNRLDAWWEWFFRAHTTVSVWHHIILYAFAGNRGSE